MSIRNITYKQTKRIPVGAAHAFFQRTQWWDWFSRSDAEWRLKHCLYLATAWHGRRMVGMAMLTGDGRIDVELYALVVERFYRRMGIGTTLMKMVMHRVAQLSPYIFYLESLDSRSDKFYRRFGFRCNKRTKLMEHGPTANTVVTQIRQMRRRNNRPRRAG